MLKKPLNKEKLAKQQERFIDAVEGIGDVLLYETGKKTKSKDIITGLNDLERITEDFFTIKQKYPDKFEQLLLSQEFFGIHNENKQEAELRLAFYPDKYLLASTALINQFVRIHEKALEVNNEEISKQAIYKIITILSHLAVDKENELFIKQLLDVLLVSSKKATEKGDASMYSASIHWYIDIVFNELGSNKIDINNLPTFDRYFYSSLINAIKNDKSGLFESFVSYVTEGFHDGSLIDIKGDLWDLSHVLLHRDIRAYNELDEKEQLEKTIAKIVDNSRYIYNKENLDDILSKVEGIATLVEGETRDQEDRDKITELKSKVQDNIILTYKYNNLLEIVQALGSYCTYLKKFDYIKLLWTYRQPEDADATWGGTDIIPSSLDDVIHFYFKEDRFRRRFEFWDGHHGTEIYQLQYFLLLISKYLHTMQPNVDGVLTGIIYYDVPIHDAHVLSDIEHSVDDLINILERKDFQEAILHMGLPNDIIASKLQPFLNRLKASAKEQLGKLLENSSISEQRVKMFVNEVISTWKEHTELRNILVFYNLYDDATDTSETRDRPIVGFFKLENKEVFLSDWYIDYSKWGEDYGRGLAEGEDKYIWEQLNTKTSTNFNDDIVLDTSKKFIILAPDKQFYTQIQYSSNFTSVEKNPQNALNTPKYRGLYTIKGVSIPVFSLSARVTPREALIVNMNKIGRFVQLPLLDDEFDTDHIYDNIYISIKDLATDTELRHKHVSNPKFWDGYTFTDEDKEHYMNKRVQLKILERYVFELHPNFEGYKITLN